MSRLADRFAVVFLAATMIMAGAAWFLTANPIRAVAVLVVATPCPLILDSGQSFTDSGIHLCSP
jgi:cation transport ATPase